MGVYCIRNTSNGKIFVSSSKDIQARINRHKMELKMRREGVKELQHDWLEFGADSFEFETCDTLEPSDKSGYDPAEDLKVLEQLWLEKLQPWGTDGYNTKK